MRVPVGAAGEPGGDHRLAERLERARDVDALAAGHRRLLDGAVAAAEPEVRHRQRLVDRGVERDGDDHDASPCPSGPSRRRVDAPPQQGQVQATRARARASTARVDDAAEVVAERAAPSVGRADGARGDERRRGRRRGRAGARRSSRRARRRPAAPRSRAGAPVDVRRACARRGARRAHACARRRGRRRVVAVLRARAPARAPRPSRTRHRRGGSATGRSAAARSESASRAASLGSPSTALTSVTPSRVAEPTST